jgi:hypothetical protein
VPRLATSPKDEAHASDRAQHPIGRHSIGPAEEPLAQRPDFGVQEDIQRRLPVVGKPHVGMGDTVDQNVGIAPASVHDAAEPEEGGEGQGDGCEEQPSALQETKDEGRKTDGKLKVRSWRLVVAQARQASEQGEEGQEPAPKRREICVRPEAPGVLFGQQRGQEVQSDEDQAERPHTGQQAARHPAHDTVTSPSSARPTSLPSAAR